MQSGYSARFIASGKLNAGRIKSPFGSLSPVTRLAPSDLKPVSSAGLNRSVIRIASAQVNQLPGYNSRGQTLDRLCTPAIRSRFGHLVSRVFARQSPMSVT